MRDMRSQYINAKMNKTQETDTTSSHPIPYAKGFIFILMKRYVYPSQAQASLIFVTVPSTTSAFKLSFKEFINYKSTRKEILTKTRTKESQSESVNSVLTLFTTNVKK